MISPLRDNTFRRLFSAQLVALFGTGMTTIGLALLAYQLAGDKAGQVLGTVLALKMVAYVLISPLTGAINHRLPRRSLLVGLDLFRAVLVMSLPWVDALWQVYLLVFLLNASSAVFTPVFQATIPDILPDEARYTQALSLSRLAYDLENLLSPALAALLLTLASFDLLFVANGVAFLASALLVLSASLPAARKACVAERLSRRLGKGMRIYLQTPRLQGLLALSLAVAAAGAMQIVNTVTYVRNTLGLDETHVALAFAATGVGSILAALGVPWLMRKYAARALMLAGGLLLSIGLLVGMLEPHYVTLLFLWALLGLGASLVLTPSGLLLRRSCREEDRGALFAAHFSLSHACWLLTYPLAGWLGATVGFESAFLLLAMIAGVATLTAARRWPRQDPSVLAHEHGSLDGHPDDSIDREKTQRSPLWEPGVGAAGDKGAKRTVRHAHPFVIDEHHTRWPG